MGFDVLVFINIVVGILGGVLAAAADETDVHTLAQSVEKARKGVVRKLGGFPSE